MDYLQSSVCALIHTIITLLFLLLSYNLESGVWNTVPINSGLVPRYGHSLAAYQVNTDIPQHNFGAIIKLICSIIISKSTLKHHVFTG